MIEVLVLASALFHSTPLCGLIGRSTLMETAQGFGLVTPDPFSSLVPRQLFAERESSLVNCLYRFGSNILKLP